MKNKKEQLGKITISASVPGRSGYRGPAWGGVQSRRITSKSTAKPTNFVKKKKARSLNKGRTGAKPSIHNKSDWVLKSGVIDIREITQKIDMFSHFTLPGMNQKETNLLLRDEFQLLLGDVVYRVFKAGKHAPLSESMDAIDYLESFCRERCKSTKFYNRVVDRLFDVKRRGGIEAQGKQDAQDITIVAKPTQSELPLQLPAKSTIMA